jgi:hypothetical protein
MLPWIIEIWMQNHGWGEPTRTLVPWRQGFRHPKRNECMGWFAQIQNHLISDINYNTVNLYFPQKITRNDN